MKEKLAIVGTGIAGMGAAHFLQEKYDITLYEKENRIGGHTNTVYVDNAWEKYLPIDTGFMVFNEVTYPNLIKLFKKLKVPYKNTDMSFSVQHRPSNLEYNGSSLGGLFAQKKNFLNPRFIKMLWEINKFNQKSPMILEDPSYDHYTISDYVKEMGFGDDFYYRFLVPMSSAVWSTPVDKMGSFPAKSLIRFFYNHGFLGMDTQHQWKTVCGGSETYKKILIEPFREKFLVGEGAQKISKNSQGLIEVKGTSGETKIFNKVIIAAHGDEALKMLGSPTPMQEKLLSTFKYQENVAVLHTDERSMPKTCQAWSAWNYVINNDQQGKHNTYTVYWMNKLQDVSRHVNYFININGEEEIDPLKVEKRIVYHHPLFDQKAVHAQKELPLLNEQSEGIYFCGSYFRYGFHEDALSSSVNLCRFLLGKEEI